MDLEALERAVSGAKEDMARGGEDSVAFMKLKTERDLLKRLIDSGDWQDDAAPSPRAGQALH
jgi:DNA primase